MAKTQDDRLRLRGIYTASLEVMTFVALPVSVGMFVLSEELILVLFGPKWSSVVPVLTILSLGVFFRTAYKCSDTLARSLGAVYQHAARQAVYTVLVVGGAWFGAALYGLEGVACAVVLAVVVNYLVMTRLSARFLSLSLREVVLPHVPGIWVATWVFVALWIGMPFVRDELANPFLRLCVGGLLAGVYAVFGVCTAPEHARSRVLPQVVARLPLQRFGVVAGVAERLVKR